MQSKSMDFVVGLVFVSGMSILGYATIFKGELLSGEKKYYAINFPKVYGLKEGSEVRCEGKKVGKVKSLKLVEDSVQAVIEIKADIKIYANTAKVKVTPFSPLGGRIVDITRGNPTNVENPRLYQDVAYLGDGKIEGLDGSQSPEVIQGDAEGELLSALTELIKANRENIDKIVENIRDATDRLGEKDNLMGKVLTDEQLAERFDNIATNIDGATKSLDNIIQRVDRGEGVVGGLVTEDSELERNVNRLTEKAADTFDELAIVAKNLNEGEGAVPRLLNDKKIGDDLAVISDNFAGFSGKLNSDQGIMQVFTEDEVYDNLESISKDLREVAAKANDPEAGAVGRLVSDPKVGEDVSDISGNLADASKKINSKDSGTLGVLISDEELGQTTRQVFSEAGRVIKEFRDSTEDIREQAPVSAFLGTVFAAF